jgi:hypothetical protein
MEGVPEDMEQRKQMILSMCTCKGCPSWLECGEKGGFCFVMIGKSACITEDVGCICGGCPVYPKLGLEHLHFCIRDSEKVQKGG